MRRQNYFPSRLGDQANWLGNYANKLPLYAPLLGLDAEVVTASVADARWGNYVLGSWLPAVRAFSPSPTDRVEEVLSGDGVDRALPTFTAPPVPAGVTATPPGVLARVFNTAAIIKRSGGYTEAIGTDLGIIGPELTEQAEAPKFTATTVQGMDCQCVKFTFSKYSHMGIYLECRRGGANWEFVAIDTESPYLDELPLLAPGTPEVREYRMRFWDRGTPNGDWSDVVKVTVSP